MIYQLLASFFIVYSLSISTLYSMEPPQSAVLLHVSTSSQDQDKCGICWGKLDFSPKILPCPGAHKLHQHCYDELESSAQEEANTLTCPYCRHVITHPTQAQIKRAVIRQQTLHMLTTIIPARQTLAVGQEQRSLITSAIALFFGGVSAGCFWGHHPKPLEMLLGVSAGVATTSAIVGILDPWLTRLWLNRKRMELAHLEGDIELIAPLAHHRKALIKRILGYQFLAPSALAGITMAGLYYGLGNRMPINKEALIGSGLATASITFLFGSAALGSWEENNHPRLSNKVRITDPRLYAPQALVFKLDPSIPR